MCPATPASIRRRRFCDSVEPLRCKPKMSNAVPQRLEPPSFLPHQEHERLPPVELESFSSVGTYPRHIGSNVTCNPVRLFAQSRGSRSERITIDGAPLRKVAFVAAYGMRCGYGESWIAPDVGRNDVVEESPDVVRPNRRRSGT